MNKPDRTPYDGSDPMERAAGWLILIFFLSTVGIPMLLGLGRWVLRALFGVTGPLGWIFG